MGKLEEKNSGDHPEVVRLNRFLAMAGVGSRRSNDELILSGAVKINGRAVTELGVRVDPSRDHVTVRGKQIHVAGRNIYIVLNKPKDAITTMSDEKGRDTVMKYVQVRDRVFPVGRLDRNTTGVLLFTNDGTLAHALLHPSKEFERMYRVTLREPASDDDLRNLRRGVSLEDGFARVQRAECITGSKRKKVLVMVHEGRNREVRRLFEKLGHDVRQLDRVSFAGITPLGLPRGSWRYLTRAEVRSLRNLAGLPSAVSS